MKEDKTFYDQFKPLHNVKDEAPMHLWPKVLEEIQPEPKRKKRFLWLSLLAFAFLLFGGLLLKNTLLNSKKPSLATTTNSPKVPAKTIQSTLPSKQSPSVDIQEEVNTKKTTPVLAKAVKPLSEKKEFIKTPPSNPTNNKQPLFSQYQGKIQPSIHLDTNNPVNPKEAVSNIQKNTSEAHSIAADSPMIEQPIDQPRREPAKNKVTEQPIQVQDQKTETLPKINPDKECAGSRIIKVPSSIFVDAYISPVLGNTFFTARTTEEKYYAKLRDSTEKNGVGIMTGVRLGYIHSSGLNIRAGVAYQQINTTFKYTIEEDEKMIVRTVRDGQGNIIGRDTTYEFGRRNLRLANRYRTVDIPISIGYISMKNRVQIGLHVGAILNLKFSQSGSYLSKNHKLRAFKDSKMFNKKMGMSFFGSLELQYLLGEQWGIFLEPQIRFYPKNITLSNAPLEQHITTFNVLTGIKYIF